MMSFVIWRIVRIFFWTIVALIITIMAVLVPDSLKSWVNSSYQVWNSLVTDETSKQKQHNNHPNKANREYLNNHSSLSATM